MTEKSQKQRVKAKGRHPKLLRNDLKLFLKECA